MPISDMARKLKLFRIANDKSQADIAQAIGVRKGTVSSYETGNITPPLDTLGKLATFYNTTVDHLVGLDNRFVFALPPETTKEQYYELMKVVNSSLKLAGIKEIEIPKEANE